MTTEITYAGCRGGEAPLTWGQRYIWQIIQALSPNDAHINMPLSVELPAPRPLDETVAHLGALMARFDTLRTVYPRSGGTGGGGQAGGAGGGGHDGPPRQRRLSDGSAPLHISEISEMSTFAAELARERFDIETGPMVRWGLAVENGLVHGIAAGMSHMVSDGAGLRLLTAALLDEPGPSDWQPFDQADFEASPEGAEVDRRSLTFWRRQLEQAPLTRPATEDPADPRYWHGFLYSTALDAGSAMVGSSAGISSNTVLLATVGIVLGRLFGEARPLLISRVSNRLTDAGQRSVGHLSQATPIVFELAETSFRKVLGQTARAAVSAFRHGRYDPEQLDELIAEVGRERGGAVDVFHTLNCTGQAVWPGTLENVSLEDIALARKSTRFEWVDKRAVEAIKTFVYVQPGVGMSLFADTSYVPPDRVEAALFGIEDLLAQAAAGADDLPEMLHRAGLS